MGKPFQESDVPPLPWPSDLMTTTEVAALVGCANHLVEYLCIDHEIARLQVGNNKMLGRDAQTEFRRRYIQYRSRQSAQRASNRRATVAAPSA